MGTSDPRIYYYPDPNGSLQSIDFGEGLSDLQEMDSAIVADGYGGDGTMFRAFTRSTLQLRIVLERFGTPGSSSLERKLKTLQAHLQRGGLIGFSRNHSKTWASRGGGTPARGHTLISTPGNLFTAWSASGALADGDEVVIESAPPECLREIATLDSLSGGAVTIDFPGCIYSYAQDVVVRWRDFYPVLWLPADGVGSSIVTHDHRRNFTLDLTLEYSPAVVMALYGASNSGNGEWVAVADMGVSSQVSGLALRDDTTVGPGVGSSIDQLIGRANWLQGVLKNSPLWRG